ncbi:MAG TPA: rod shape-determining protein MreC [Noviherbaspirillum sp.]|nr:rod shape-determining protein MreC [Noviherbaspirillum sp.]
MEYSPPPLFKQGASARAKVVFFSLIALILLVADSRLRSLTTIRQFVGTMLYPLQAAALMPRDAAYMVNDYFSTLSAMKKENDNLKLQQVANAQTLQQVQQLSSENAQLRKLLAANERLPVKSVMSEILYDARDAFTRKIVLDRGSRHGVTTGQPVIDDIGVVGQVTRVFPFTSEVTLLTDKDQAIPVQVVRSGLRSIAYGQGHSGSLDLRFMPANADIKNGDVLVTSGIDGVYPAGLSVAKVVQVESKSSDAFARIVCQPLAGIDRNRQLLILLTEPNFPPLPPPEDVKERAAKKHGVDLAKEAPKEPQKEQPKDPAKEAPKDPAKAPVAPVTDASKVPAKEAPKGVLKEAVKELRKDAVAGTAEQKTPAPVTPVPVTPAPVQKTTTP